MTTFRKPLLAAAALASLMATAAGAAVIVDPAPWPGGGPGAYTGPTNFDHVHSCGTQSASTTICGELQTGGQLVTYQSNNTTNMIVNGSGVAYVKDEDNSDGLLLSDFDIFLTNPLLGFSAIEFNLEASGITGPDGIPVWAFMSVDFLGGGSASLGSFSLANGENKFRVFGDTGEVFGKIKFDIFDANSMTANRRGLEGIKQVDIAVIPEPASWVMMIAGFGLVGAAMRRRGIKTVIA